MVQTFYASLLYPLLARFLQLVPITMELVAPIKEPKALLNSRHELQETRQQGVEANGNLALEKEQIRNESLALFIHILFIVGTSHKRRTSKGMALTINH